MRAEANPFSCNIFQQPLFFNLRSVGQHSPHPAGPPGPTHLLDSDLRLTSFHFSEDYRSSHTLITFEVSTPSYGLKMEDPFQTRASAHIRHSAWHSVSLQKVVPSMTHDGQHGALCRKPLQQGANAPAQCLSESSSETTGRARVQRP